MTPKVGDMFAEDLWARAQAAQRTRAADMPTEQDALNRLFECWLRLKELGWREAVYMPKDHSIHPLIECGSTGIHNGYHDETGRYWIVSDNDSWPSSPILYRPPQPVVDTTKEA